MTPLESATSWSQRVIAVTLALALGAAGLLGWQALAAAGAHRSAAEAVLGDYVRFAAAQFSLRARERLDLALQYTVEPLACAPSPEVQRSRAASAMAAPAPAPANCAGPLRAVAAVARRPGGGVETLAGVVPPEAVPAIATLPERPCATRATCLVVLDAAAEPILAAVSHGPAASGREIPLTIVLLTPAHIAALLRQVVDSGGLLPASLAGDRREPWLALLAVRAGRWRLDERPVAFPAQFVETVTLGDLYGRLEADLALDPASAEALVIGGLPGSRVPYVLGLLLVTVVLLGVAWRQWSDERRLAQSRSRFIAGASHELRTPIAQIRLFAETLALGRVRSSHERDRSLAIIQAEAGRLAHLVDNLLQAARGGRMPRGAPEPTDLAAFVRDSTAAFAPLARQAGMTLAVDAPPTLPGCVDRAALRRTLLNLLDNAVKYGPCGQTITVRLEERPGEARLFVADEGPGVPAEATDRIWQPFVRLDRPVDRAVPGTGLGLSIVRDAVAALGGEATVTPAPGGGARFAITLPIRSPASLASTA